MKFVLAVAAVQLTHVGRLPPKSQVNMISSYCLAGKRVPNSSLPDELSTTSSMPADRA